MQKRTFCLEKSLYGSLTGRNGLPGPGENVNKGKTNCESTCFFVWVRYNISTLKA